MDVGCFSAMVVKDEILILYDRNDFEHNIA